MGEKLNSIVTRLQKAEDLLTEVEKLLDDDDKVQAEVDAQGYRFDMVGERIHGKGHCKNAPYRCQWRIASSR